MSRREAARQDLRPPHAMLDADSTRGATAWQTIPDAARQRRPSAAGRFSGPSGARACRTVAAGRPRLPGASLAIHGAIHGKIRRRPSPPRFTPGATTPNRTTDATGHGLSTITRWFSEFNASASDEILNFQFPTRDIDPAGGIDRHSGVFVSATELRAPQRGAADHPGDNPAIVNASVTIRNVAAADDGTVQLWLSDRSLERHLGAAARAVPGQQRLIVRSEYTGGEPLEGLTRSGGS